MLSVDPKCNEFIQQHEHSKWMTAQAIAAAWELATKLAKKECDPHDLGSTVLEQAATITDLERKLAQTQYELDTLTEKFANQQVALTPGGYDPFGYLSVVVFKEPGSEITTTHTTIMRFRSERYQMDDNETIIPLYSAEQLLGDITEPRIARLLADLSSIGKLQPSKLNATDASDWLDAMHALDTAQTVIRNAAHWCTKPIDPSTLHTWGSDDTGKVTVQSTRSSFNPREDHQIMTSALELSQAVTLRKVNFPEFKLGGLLVRPNPEIIGDESWIK